MKGAVAAGHPLTAQAGAEILAEGGNAVDACIAAAFVSWVAESPDRLVGRLSLSRDPHPASRHVADVGLMVALDFRRRGVGRALMLAAEDWARSVGVRKIELHVFPHNTGAIALYDELGYRREGVRLGQYRRGTTYVDAILMAKDVS